jgi:hypothetical protein
MTLKINSAELTRDTEVLSSMSPFCIITYRGESYQTKIAKG